MDNNEEIDEGASEQRSAIATSNGAFSPSVVGATGVPLFVNYPTIDGISPPLDPNRSKGPSESYLSGGADFESSTGDEFPTNDPSKGREKLSTAEARTSTSESNQPNPQYQSCPPHSSGVDTCRASPPDADGRSGVLVLVDPVERGSNLSPAEAERSKSYQQKPNVESPSSYKSRPSKNADDGTFMTSETGAKLFHLMEIRPDRQDLSFVEKIILPRGQIVSFCQALNADSTRVSREGELSLRFEQLDQSSLNVVGFYGSKDLLIGILESCNAIASNDEIYAGMRDDSLLPGLYALLHESTVMVFYWHHGPVLPSASRKDISCNFVRYLVDLCDFVFILLEGSGVAIREALNTGRLAKTGRQARVLNMTIELKATENEVDVLRGFTLELNICGSAPWEKNSFAGLSTTRLICEGSRCGVLSYTRSPPSQSWRLKKKAIKLEDISSVANIIGGRSVDFESRELQDDDLSIFLQCSGCPVGKQYVRQLEDFERVRDDFRSAQKNQQDREQRLMKFTGEVENAITNFVSEYLKTSQKFTWEEALRANATLEDLQTILLKPASEDAMQCKESPANNPQGILSKIGQSVTTAIGSVILGSKPRDTPINFRPKHSQGGLTKLESDIFTGSGRFDKLNHRFIFEGNKARLRNVKTSDSHIYTIEHAYGSKVDYSPLCHGDRLILRSVRSRQPPKEMTFRTKDGSSRGPILTNTRLLGDTFGGQGDTFGLRGEYMLDVIKEEFALGGLEDWVASEAGRVLPRLGRKASLLSYVLAICSTDDDVWSETRIEQVLAFPDNQFLQAVESGQSPEATDDIRATWADICKGASQVSVLLENVVGQCLAVYERARAELCRAFEALFKSYMKKLLELWIHHEDDESWKALEQKLKEEKGRVLNDLRLNQTHRDQSKVKLHSCYIGAPGNYGYNYYRQDVSNVRKYLTKAKNGGHFKLFLEYDEVVTEMETEKWLVQELSSPKLDLEKLEMDPNHTFIPTQQGPRHVLSLNPVTQRLLKLAFLRNGQYLGFILTQMEQCHVLLVPPGGGESVVHTMGHGFDLIAFDEQTRYVALYDKVNLMIKTYRFEEGYKHLEFLGAEIYLSELGVTSVTWMKLIPGRAEVVFVDSDHKVRVFEMAIPGMVRAKEIQLPCPFVRAEVTRQGPCLLVFNKPTTEGQSSVNTTLQMEVYWINQSMSHFSTIPVHTFKERIPLKIHFEVAVHSFGPQEHLLLYTEDDPHIVQSQVLKITSASDEYHLLSDAASEGAGPQKLNPGLALDYLYHVYEKFSTNPPLAKQSRALSFYIVLNEHDLKDDCLQYLETCFRKLQTEKGKNFHGLDKQCIVREPSEVSLVLANIARNASGSGKRGLRTRSMGDWVRQLLCLVPIQIARAENNCLKSLADGLELSADVDYDNTVSLASLLHFGFYDAVFASWRNKPVKIISSMGKQSSGKSYLLNHLSGSLLDVSGGRCTDGVWMTVRISDGDRACMYVLLDFEGVGTLERSEQEDMLLSVLNAAISNITIYNKKDFNLDRETETVFERFQNGVSLVKDDEKLFSGLFYMAVKDVGEDDLRDLHVELTMKIKRMLHTSRENFLTKMYGGRVTLGLMASFDTPHFYTSIDQIYETINGSKFRISYMDGRSFSTDLKLLIAQLCAKDWGSMDSKRMELRVYLIHAHLNSAIGMGRLDTKGNEVNLVNFDTQEEIEDNPIHLGNNVFVANDTGLKLKPCDDDDSIGDILTSLKELFQDVVQRSGENDEGWHSGFIQFLEALVDRRGRRVLEWISCNAQMFQEYEEVQRIKLEATALCTGLKQKLSLCSCTCEQCCLRCIKEKGHDHGHSCLGDHMCSQSCSYCVTENVNDRDKNPINKCMDVAGHQGSHDCRSKDHTCKENCVYHGIAANCNSKCVGTVGHSEKHLCNSREHKCSETCSLGSCNNRCVTPFEIQDHSPHACHEKFCPKPCSMKGCNRICASKDHFHDNNPFAKHMCGLTHPCTEKCEAHGNCAVQQDLIKTTRTFESKYGSFEYEHVAEQTGIRKLCCIEIPASQTTHEGPHSHTRKQNAVHLCDTKCGACGYFCTNPIGHDGFHKTVHGNMRDTTFAAESERIQVGERNYAWGESGAAEMCNMHCKTQGRGHIHLALCPAAHSTRVCYSKLYPDGVQHESKKYGPIFDVPKDEMTHAAYWRHMQFVDPCTEEDQALFNLCGHECQSEEHNPLGTSGEKKKMNKSFCSLQVWHNPISEQERMKFTAGYVTADGHHMDCKHERASNVVFVIDRSYSMDDTDIKPQLVQFQKTHNYRLGCVFEAILRFVRTRSGLLLSEETDLASVVLFNHRDPAITAVELEVMDEGIVDKLLQYRPAGCTTFSTGLKEAERILLKAAADGNKRPPVLVFLSDGENDYRDNDNVMTTVKSMKSRLGEELQIFTVQFGNDKKDIMTGIADKGKAYVSRDHQMLSGAFMDVARSLKPQTAALIERGDVYADLTRPLANKHRVKSHRTSRLPPSPLDWLSPSEDPGNFSGGMREEPRYQRWNYGKGKS